MKISYNDDGDAGSITGFLHHDAGTTRFTGGLGGLIVAVLAGASILLQRRQEDWNRSCERLPGPV